MFAWAILQQEVTLHVEVSFLITLQPCNSNSRFYSKYKDLSDTANECFERRVLPGQLLKYSHSVLFVAIQSLLRHYLGELRVSPGDFSRHGEAHFRLVKQFDRYVGVRWLLRVLRVFTDDLYESRI